MISLAAARVLPRELYTLASMSVGSSRSVQRRAPLRSRNGSPTPATPVLSQSSAEKYCDCARAAACMRVSGFMSNNIRSSIASRRPSACGGHGAGRRSRKLASDGRHGRPAGQRPTRAKHVPVRGRPG